MTNTTLPLSGIRVLEFGGLAPGPFCGVLLADYGADVVRVDRLNEAGKITNDLLCRHKRSITLDLKSADDIAKFRTLSQKADVIIDPFRPGVLERLGLGPEVLMKENPRLIFARLTGFRRDGKYKDMAGHDINYIATSGVLSMLGRAGEPPYAPANIVADFGGGLTCFAGILLALFSRVQTGKGQLVHSSMVDASAYLATFPRMLLKASMWSAPRGTNTLDGGCPYYGTYATSDGRYMAIGALEPQFYTVLMSGLGLPCNLATREDKANWPGLKADFERVFASKTRAEWEAIFDGTDACCTPVLTQQELEARGDENRAAVELVDTPAKPTSEVSGKGWTETGMVAGKHNEEVFNEWTGGPANTVANLWSKVRGWSKL